MRGLLALCLLTACAAARPVECRCSCPAPAADRSSRALALEEFRAYPYGPDCDHVEADFVGRCWRGRELLFCVGQVPFEHCKRADGGLL